MARARARLVRAVLLALPLGAIEMSASGAAYARGTDSNSATSETNVDAGTITSSTNETLQLAVIVNGRSVEQVGEFLIRAGQLYAQPDELQKLGFRVPQGVRLVGGLVPLDGSPGLAARIDEPTQSLYITADPQWLQPTVLGSSITPGNYVVESSPGATLNYDLIGTSANGQTVASGALDFRAFSRLGVFSSGLLFHASPSSQAADGFKAVRLDTTYVYSDPNSLRRYRLGDFINGGLPWTRPIRMGGAQVNLDFSMRPDLITFPVPQISGSAAVPSTVDVLVNNTKVVSGSVTPGPFEVPQVPVINGSGTVTTTVTDALGRQVVSELPFYATSALLSPNLQTYSGEVGFVRRNWGFVSNDYGPFAASLTYRRGLSDYLTVETHGEATKGVAMAGIGAVANLFDFAVANLAAAASTHAGQSGFQLAAGIERVSGVLSFGGSVILADKRFADLAAISGDPVSTLQLNLHAGLSLREFGSLGVSFTEVRRSTTPIAPDPQSTALSVPQPQRSKIFSASYSRQLGRMSLFATAFHDFAATNKSNAVLVGIALPLGRRMSANVSGQSASGELSAQAEIDQNAEVPGDWGFRAYLSADGQGSSQGSPARSMSDHEFGQVTYKSQWGQVFAGVDRVAGQTTVQGELVGSISFIDNGVFLANRIDNSFAVVDTGVPGIRVREENRDVGRTNSSGRIVVPDLLAFEPNHVSIEPLDAPVDADVPVTERDVRPLDRSGVVIRLPVKISHGALLRIVDASGKPIQVGSSATLKSTSVAVAVGYDGEAYVVDLQRHNDVLVEEVDGRRCNVAFDYKSVPGTIPTLGPLICREVAS